MLKSNTHNARNFSVCMKGFTAEVPIIISQIIGAGVIQNMYYTVTSFSGVLFWVDCFDRGTFAAVFVFYFEKLKRGTLLCQQQKRLSLL